MIATLFGMLAGTMAAAVTLLSGAGPAVGIAAYLVGVALVAVPVWLSREADGRDRHVDPFVRMRQPPISPVRLGRGV